MPDAEAISGAERPTAERGPADIVEAPKVEPENSLDQACYKYGTWVTLGHDPDGKFMNALFIILLCRKLRHPTSIARYGDGSISVQTTAECVDKRWGLAYSVRSFLEHPERASNKVRLDIF